MFSSRVQAAALCALSLSWLASATEMTYELVAHEKACFYEEMDAGVQGTLEFQVIRLGIASSWQAPARWPHRRAATSTAPRCGRCRALVGSFGFSEQLLARLACLGVALLFEGAAIKGLKHGLQKGTGPSAARHKHPRASDTRVRAWRLPCKRARRAATPGDGGACQRLARLVA